MDPLRIFDVLTEISDFRRRNMPFIQSLVDLDLMREIGHHQARGRALNLDALLQLRIASSATVQRRLSRLKRLGLVQQAFAKHDGRILYLTLTSKSNRLYRRLERKILNSR